MKVLGIDYGEKRIGIATADRNIRIAFPWGVIKNKADGLDQCIEQIVDLCKEEDVVEIIVGKAVNLLGEKTASTDKGLSFAAALKDKIDIPLILFDERMTTKRAEAIMHQQGLSPSRNRDKLNAIAAAVILEDYLESLRC